MSAAPVLDALRRGGPWNPQWYTEAWADVSKKAFRRDLAEALSRRVVDMRHLEEAVNDAFQMVEVEGTDGYMSSSKADIFGPREGDPETVESSLPLVSPPRIGMPGVWILSDAVAAVVAETNDPDVHLVYSIELVEGALVPTPAVAEVHADGEQWGMKRWRIQLTPFGERWGKSPTPTELATGHSYPWHDAWASEVTLRATSVMIGSTIAQADPGVVTHTAAPAARKKKAAKRGKATPGTTTTINLPGLRYKGGRYIGTHPSSGRPWHLVRGFWRRLSHPRYGARVGTRVWVRPHARGDVDLGVSTAPYKIAGGTK